MIALKYGLECKHPLAGIIGLSGFLFPSANLTNLGKTNILLQHGELDQVIPLEYSSQSYERLKDDPKVKMTVVKGL